MAKALIVVDVQKDFCEGGALAVEGGNAVAVGIHDYILNHHAEYAEIFFTRDWHKPWPETNGGHFSETPDFVDSWPPHCQQGTEGAKMHPYLAAFAQLSEPYSVFYKGDGRPDYSGFQGFSFMGDSLVNALLDCGIDEVDIVGIAGDYCVKQTALDAVREGFKVYVIDRLVASVGGDAATRDMLDEVENLSQELAD